MPDFLTRRNHTWHFVRRVPSEFAAFDPRGIIKHSTKIRVVDDRNGRRASLVADKLNRELEAHWRGLIGLDANDQASRYEQARLHVRALGFDFLDVGQLITLPPERTVERAEALITKGLHVNPEACAGVFGTIRQPEFPLSQLQQQHEAMVGDKIKNKSPEQRRVWRTERIRAAQNFVGVVGDKPVTQLSDADGIAYFDWLKSRVVNDEITAKTANKDINVLSGMLKDVRSRRRYPIPELFNELKVRGETEKSRVPFESDFIQRCFLSGALAGLNDEARNVLYVMIETGMRPSEIVNLQQRTIHLDAPIPFVEILPDGRQLKSEDSRRQIPLVGVALEAMKRQPHGFPRYRDKSSHISGTLNKYLKENGLRPTSDHTVYSLRHSFKDRLVAAQAQDSLIDSLMGHATGKVKYGNGPALDLKLKFLEQIAFPCPETL